MQGLGVLCKESFVWAASAGAFRLPLSSGEQPSTTQWWRLRGEDNQLSQRPCYTKRLLVCKQWVVLLHRPLSMLDALDFGLQWAPSLGCL